jgi:hypothetical protein
MQFQKSKFLSAIWHGLVRTAPYWGILAAVLVLVAWLLKDRVSNQLAAARNSKVALLSRQQALKDIRDIELTLQQLWKDLTNIAVRVEDTHSVAVWILQQTLMEKAKMTERLEYPAYAMIEPNLIRLERHRSSRRLLVLALQQTEEIYDLALDLVVQPQFKEKVGQTLDILQAAIRSFDDAAQRFEQSVREICGSWPVEPEAINKDHVDRIQAAIKQYTLEVAEVMKGALPAINDNFNHFRRLYDLVEYELLTLGRSSASWSIRLFWISLFASLIAIAGKWLEIQNKKKR